MRERERERGLYCTLLMVWHLVCLYDVWGDDARVHIMLFHIICKPTSFHACFCIYVTHTHQGTHAQTGVIERMGDWCTVGWQGCYTGGGRVRGYQTGKAGAGADAGAGTGVIRRGHGRHGRHGARKVQEMMK